MEKEDEEGDIKVILLGESGMGKTSLINAALGLDFEENMASTISSSFVTKDYIKNNKIYRLNIWDTAGQETYRALTKLFIKNSKIVLFVYSINNKLSFEGLQTYWVSMAKEILVNEAVYALVGSKSDLYNEEQVKDSEGMEYAEKIGAKFTLASAKTNKEGFISFLEELLDEFLSKNKGGVTKDKSFEIKKEKHKKKKNKNKCCQ